MARKVVAVKPIPIRLNLNAGGQFTCSCIDGKRRTDFKIFSDGTRTKHYFCFCGKVYTENDIPAHS